MLWASWTTVHLCLVSAAVVAYLSREPRLSRRLLVIAFSFVVDCWIVAPRLTAAFSAWLCAPLVAVITACHLDRFLLGNANMISTGVAVVWCASPRSTPTPAPFSRADHGRAGCSTEPTRPFENPSTR